MSGDPNDNETNVPADNSTPTSVCEGKAVVVFPSALDVFYNPVQEFNRDLSIAVLRLFSAEHKACQEKINTTKSKLNEAFFKDLCYETNVLEPKVVLKDGIKILEALSASGLRSLRYAQEVGGIKEIVANDISISAVNCMKNNIKTNHVEDLVTPSWSDASLLMYQSKNKKERFHVIDLDPYGSPHQFLDSAVQAVSEGGLLMITSTDMGVLCGNAPETAFIKYGATGMKHSACHELGLRILLKSVESAAIKYGRYIVPLLSLSIDFYARIFVRVFTSPVQCKRSYTKMAWVNKCVECEATTFQRLGNITERGPSIKYNVSSMNTGTNCDFCKSRMITCGPVWADAIHDVNFVKRLLTSLVESDFKTYRRMEGMLTLAVNELPNCPLYFKLDQFVSRLKLGEPPKRSTVISALLNHGYNVSETHAAKNAIKTNAPLEFMFNIARELFRKNELSFNELSEDHLARRILDKLTPVTIDFTPNSDAEFPETQGILKFQHNPEKNWGPKSKAKTSVNFEDFNKKSIRKQGWKTQKRRLLETEIKQKKLKTDHISSANTFF